MKRVRTHTNPLNIIHRFDDIKIIDNDTNRQLDLEIGFGKGKFIRHWAKKYPERHVVGVEVRKQVVDLLQEKVNTEELDNISLFHGNGLIFIEDAVEDESLNNIFIFHPDPWFKKKHNKRRVVNEDFLKLAIKKLKKEHYLHISTDVDLLWEDITKKIAHFPTFQKEENHIFWTEDYTSHWHTFSETDNRNIFFSSYKKV